MEYYSAIKNELSSQEKIQRNLKCILLSESRQSEMVTYCMIPTILHSGKHKTTETIKRSVVARGSGGERDEQVEPGIFRAVKLFCVISF